MTVGPQEFDALPKEKNGDTETLGQEGFENWEDGCILPKITPNAAERVMRRFEEMVLEDPEYEGLSTFQLNKEAVVLFRRKDFIGAAASFEKLFQKVQRFHLTHPDLHICYSNRSATFLQLGMYEEALRDAESCRKLAEIALRRTTAASSTYSKSFLRKGMALLGLERPREASMNFQEGLRLDPFDVEMRRGLQYSTQKVVADLIQGKGLEIRALPPAEPTKKIMLHPYSAPLHKIKEVGLLPTTLLTPQQAERDHHIRDIYNYVTIQADVRMPKRQLRFLEDTFRHEHFQKAIQWGVKEIHHRDMICRVLDLGAGAGLHSLMALEAGAAHVTAVERWLYLSLSCKEVLEANKTPKAKFKVVYKRPTDLLLKADVPICCNLLICDILEEGLLSSGIIPAVRHALDNLMITNPVVIPASATVFAQAIQLRTSDVCGLDMSAVNRYRWSPFHTCGAQVSDSNICTLSEPVEVWYFDLLNPPNCSDRKILDITFNKDGFFNSVMFWYELKLAPGVIISSRTTSVCKGSKSLHPGIQFLAGEMRVQQGFVLPLVCSHNTVRIRFDIEGAEYMHVTKPDPSFSWSHFSMLADQRRASAYDKAIRKAVEKLKKRGMGGQELHFMFGCDTGQYN